MLDINGYLDLLNSKDFKPSVDILSWRQIYYGMSLHIDGIMPYYEQLRNPSLTWVAGNTQKYLPNNWGCEEYQSIFQNYLYSRHPREPEVTRNWRLSQHKPFTKDPFLQVIQVIKGAIFQDSGYSVTVQDKQDNEYIWGNNFDGKSLIQFLADHFQYIAEDPNGRFVVMPQEPGYATTTQQVEPKIHFIKSKDIRYVTRDEIIFDYQGYTWVINKLVILRYKEDKQKQYTHVDEKNGGYYAHLLGVVPAFVAGGTWNSQGFYDSWLDAAKPLADEYVGAISAQQLVNKEASHPYIIEASEDCPACDGGKIQYCTKCSVSLSSGDCTCSPADYPTTHRLANCEACGGTGEISRNPGSRLLVPPDMMKDDMVKIVSPDTAINKFHAEFNKDLYNGMLRALHLHYIDEAQSGTAKDKDMETRYQMIVQISNDLFDRLLEGFLNCITGMRNVTVNNGALQPTAGTFVIIKPSQFQIKTEGDLLEEYKASTEAKVPDWVRGQQVIDYVDKLYGGDAVLKRKTTLITQLDPVALKTEADKSVMVMNNAISNRDWQYSARLPMILDQLSRDKGSNWFLNVAFDEIKKMSDALFATMIPPPIPLPDTTNTDAG